MATRTTTAHDASISAPRTLDAARKWSLVAFVAVFLWSVLVFGIPVDRIAMLIWMLAGFAVGSIGRSGAQISQMFRDWLVLVVICMAYDYSRGTADQWGIPVNFTGPRNLDAILTLGHEPVSGLQRLLYTPGDVKWYDVTGSIIYMTHFVLPVLPLAVLRIRNRPEWIRYVRRFSVTLFTAVLIFIVYPAAPPWMASKQGFMPPLQRITGRGWGEVGLDSVSKTFDRGVAVLNPVAAVPSLHAGLALVVALWFTRNSARWVRGLALLHPFFMMVTLVYFGEHYIVDCLAGWLVVLFAFWVSDRWEGRRTEHTPVADPGG
ncbi:MAG: inositol phosphorylceramide synthase [Actinobacteria bacterium]|nr:inositol phosphorylceramide synthase [Actinomycetota bacterium]